MGQAACGECWLLHPTRNLGCREPMMLPACCLRDAETSSLRGPALAVASSQQSE